MFENQQAPEPRRKSDGTELDLHSIFYTIQGEGPFSGRRCVFVRFAGCNLQCPKCDTEYTQGREVRTAASIVNEVTGLFRANDTQMGCLVVITGGEPLRQNLDLFTSMLAFANIHIQIESNGVFPVTDGVADLIERGKLTLIVSPKTTRVHPKTAKLAYAFKYVLDHRSIDSRDGLPLRALEHPAATGVARPPEGKPVYVSPMDEQDEAANALHLAAVRQSALKHGHIAGVQLHKLLNIA